MSHTQFQFLFLLTGLIAIAAIPTQEKNCRISIDLSKGHLVEPQPLILTDAKNPSFLLPNEENTLIIPRHKSILLACPGANNSFANFESTQILKVRCLTGQKFSVDSSTELSKRFESLQLDKTKCQSDKQVSVQSNTYLFNTFKCKGISQDVIKESSLFCLDKHKKYEIGFEVDKNFLKLLEICRDEINYRTYYSKHILVKEINSRQNGYPKTYYTTNIRVKELNSVKSEYPSPDWKFSKHQYPRFEIEESYKFESERENLKILLGSEDLADKYIHVTYKNHKPDYQMLQRGHLTPKVDFIYGPQQRATFWLLNANPQWGSFNSGNWFYLEKSIRNFAISRRLDFISYTGVHGITTLKDVHGNKQLLHLDFNGPEKLLPVPRFFWKIIHDPISNRATAFIGLNEPYADEITEDMYLCSDIKSDHDFSWLTWQPRNITLGVSYVCTVDSLRKEVRTIPEIGETGLLV